MPRHDMHLHFSSVDDQSLKKFCRKYGILPEYNPTAPDSDHRVTDCPDGSIALYTKFFELSNLRLPFSFFFLDFLKEYRVSIAQLFPFAVMKIFHFEIACRALGGHPSLPLFRQFFRFARYGNWYTVERHKGFARGYLSSEQISKSKKLYKDSFFWVSADAIPFKMHWRQAHEPTKIIVSHSEEFDNNLYRLLLKNPMPLQTFPEHVLVMTGLSQNWKYKNAEPILKHGDEEMGLLEYIKKKGVGVKLTTRPLGENEDNILDRTRGVCYEGGSNDLAIIVGSVNSGGGDDADINPERLIFGSDTEMDPVVEPVSEKESLSESGKRQQPEAEALGSSSKKPKTIKEESDSVVVVSSDSGDESTKHSPKHDRVGCLEQLVGSVPELLKWYERKEARLRDEISRYRVRMILERKKNVKMVKKVRKLKKLKRVSLIKRREAVEMIAENTVKHQKVVEALQKEMQDAKSLWEENLKQAHKEVELQRGMVERLNEELEVEKEARTQERVSLEKSFERVSSERQWLIQEGFEYVINRLHRSGEYNRLLGGVQTKLWSSGAHYGVEEGYAWCKAGVALKDVPLFKPEAEEEFHKAVYELEHTRFPYVVALSQCADKTIDEFKALEPEEMEDGEDAVTTGGD